MPNPKDELIQLLASMIAEHGCPQCSQTPHRHDCGMPERLDRALSTPSDALTELEGLLVDITHHQNALRSVGDFRAVEALGFTILDIARAARKAAGRGGRRTTLADFDAAIERARKQERSDVSKTDRSR
jgi:hypothetical protein